MRQLGLSEVEASDPNPAACDKAREQFGIPVSSNPHEALNRNPDIALVCTPASLHISMTLQALDAGAHVFVEKPLSTNLDGVEVLAQKARAKGRIVQVGYNLRYHPAVRAMKRMLDSGSLGQVFTAHAEFGLYLAKWWPDREYQTSYMAHAGLGGGLLLDASHEIDSLLWLLGSVRRVTAFGGKLSALEIEGVDVVKVVLEMKSGAVASLHLDCLQPAYTRVYTFIGEGTGLRWDCSRGRADSSLGRLLLFDPEGDRFKPVRLRGRPEDTYVEELRDFLSSVETGKPPMVGLEEGIEVLRVVRAIREAILTNQVVEV